MDNFNLQNFVKKSKDEFYANLYEGKKKHSMEEEMHDDVKEEEKVEENHQSLDNEVADRIEGLLNIPMKAKFLSAGVDLINDFLEDEAMDVEDIVSHLANELTKEYHTAGGHDSAVGLEEVSLNVSDVEAAMSFLGGVLGLPAVAFLSAKAQEKLQDLKKSKEEKALKEEDGEEIEIEDEMEVPTVDVADVEMEAPEGEAEDSKEIFAKLVDAYESAKALGDDKLTRQLANTITYFNKSVIFGDEG